MIPLDRTGHSSPDSTERAEAAGRRTQPATYGSQANKRSPGECFATHFPGVRPRRARFTNLRMSVLRIPLVFPDEGTT